MSINKQAIEKVISIFNKHYVLVPLEVFHGDPYKTLISTLLSARTRDETTLKVCLDLFKKAPTLKKLADLSQSDLEKYFYPVGFYKTKAKHVYKLAKIVLEEQKGKIPNTREDLIKLPGVGRKTANLVLNRAFNIPAIAVDTHVHRIANILGWVHTKTPTETELALYKFLPQKYWSDMNRLFVSIGRQYQSKRVLQFLKAHNLID